MRHYIHYVIPRRAPKLATTRDVRPSDRPPAIREDGERLRSVMIDAVETIDDARLDLTTLFAREVRRHV